MCHRGFAGLSRTIFPLLIFEGLHTGHGCFGDMFISPGIGPLDRRLPARSGELLGYCTVTLPMPMAFVVCPTPITPLIPGDAFAGIAIVKAPLPSRFAVAVPSNCRGLFQYTSTVSPGPKPKTYAAIVPPGAPVPGFISRAGVTDNVATPSLWLLTPTAF